MPVTRKLDRDDSDDGYLKVDCHRAIEAGNLGPKNSGLFGGITKCRSPRRAAAAQAPAPVTGIKIQVTTNSD